MISLQLPRSRVNGVVLLHSFAMPAELVALNPTQRLDGYVRQLATKFKIANLLPQQVDKMKLDALRVLNRLTVGATTPRADIATAARNILTISLRAYVDGDSQQVECTATCLHSLASKLTSIPPSNWTEIAENVDLMVWSGFLSGIDHNFNQAVSITASTLRYITWVPTKYRNLVSAGRLWGMIAEVEEARGDIAESSLDSIDYYTSSKTALEIADHFPADLSGLQSREAAKLRVETKLKIIGPRRPR